MRIKRVLEAGAKQDALITGHNIFRAVPVVHIKINDGHAVQAVMFECVISRHGNIVEQAKTGGMAASRVVPRGANRTKSASIRLAENPIHRRNTATGGMARGVERVGRHHHIRSKFDAALLGRFPPNRIEIGRGMGAQQLRSRGGGRLLMNQPIINSLSDQIIRDGAEAAGVFGVFHTIHSPIVVAKAVGRGEISQIHRVAMRGAYCFFSPLIVPDPPVSGYIS